MSRTTAIGGLLVGEFFSIFLIFGSRLITLRLIGIIVFAIIAYFGLDYYFTQQKVERAEAYSLRKYGQSLDDMENGRKYMILDDFGVKLTKDDRALLRLWKKTNNIT